MNRSITMDLGFYAVIAVCGYFSTFESTPDLIVKRGSPDNVVDKILMMIAQVWIAAAICITIPLNNIHFRSAIFRYIFDNQELTNLRLVISSAILCTITCLITIFVPDITTVFSVVGGIGCVGICFVFPLIAFLSVNYKDKCTAYCYIFIGSLITAVGFGAALQSITQTKSKS